MAAHISADQVFKLNLLDSTDVCWSSSKLNLLYKDEKHSISNGGSFIMSNPHPRSQPSVMVTEAYILFEPISGGRHPSLKTLGAGARHHIREYLAGRSERLVDPTNKHLVISMSGSC